MVAASRSDALTRYAAGRVGQSFECDPTTSDWSIPTQVQAPASAKLACSQRDNCPEAGSGSGNREVVYCLWNAGHAWPKSAGQQESAFWGNRLMVEFFLAHRRDAICPRCAATSCVAPDRALLLKSISLYGAGLPVLTFQDPNQPDHLTGYNVYRSVTPSLPIGSWNLVVSDRLDEDLWLPDQQLIDATAGSPPPGGVFYYTGAAFNNHCPREGPL